MNIDELIENVEKTKARSAWDKAVKADALDLLDTWKNEWGYGDYYGSPADHKTLLNGADDWWHYSHSGCALCYDSQIAKRYCSPSELKRVHNGNYKPNPRESWLDVQARALYQAEMFINECVR